MKYKLNYRDLGVDNCDLYKDKCDLARWFIYKKELPIIEYSPS